MYWNLTMHWVQLKSYRAFRVPGNNFCVNCFRPIIFSESSQQISKAKETCYLYNRLPPLISCRWGLRQYVFALYVRLCVRTFPRRNTLSFGHVNLNDDGSDNKSVLSLVPRLSTWRYPQLQPQLERFNNRYASPSALERYLLPAPELRQAAVVDRRDRQTSLKLRPYGSIQCLLLLLLSFIPQVV